MSRTIKELATELVKQYWNDWETWQEEPGHPAVEPSFSNGISYYDIHVANPKECADGVMVQITDGDRALLPDLEFLLSANRLLDDETVSAFGWASAILGRALAQEQSEIVGRIVSAGMRLHPDAMCVLLLATNQMYPKE